MRKRRPQKDYVSVKRSRARLAKENIVSDKLEASQWPQLRAITEDSTPATDRTTQPRDRSPGLTLKRGHAFSYLALFVFTALLYARPGEFYPSAFTASITLIVGLVTLGLYVPTQFTLEGSISAPLFEVKLLMLFVLTTLLSIPLAIDPAQAWTEFSGAFIRAVIIFVVMVNVVRTESRLKGLIFLAIVAGVLLSIGAINDYRLDLMTVEGYRAGGRGTGIFGNSNDMALFLATTIPVTITWALETRNPIVKTWLAVAAMLMTAAVVLTYSRGAFLGSMVALTFLTLRVGSRHKATILIVGFLVVIALLVLAPGGYGRRLASIFIPSLDPVGSADARRGELFRSLYVALRHPLLGIGMGNYGPQMSYHGLVTHNSYTQVASEIGVAALVSYVAFIVSPLKKLGQIGRETLGVKLDSKFYYLSIGLQASLLAYLVCSFFASVAYLWYVYYLVAYAVCLRRIYESETGRKVVVEKRKREKTPSPAQPSIVDGPRGAVTV